MSQVNLNAQDLGADESRPEWHTNGHIGQFDAALEEVWHVISHTGYAHAYPLQAWYTYDDRTCEYECMTGEYILGPNFNAQYTRK